MKGLEEARGFYEDFGRDMLHRQFPDYEDRIAVGLVGRGSECFGFDDDISGCRKFEDLPEDFECPVCGVGKDMFSED